MSFWTETKLRPEAKMSVAPIAANNSGSASQNTANAASNQAVSALAPEILAQQRQLIAAVKAVKSSDPFG